MRTLVMAASLAAPPRAAMYFWTSSSAVCAVTGVDASVRPAASTKNRVKDMAEIVVVEPATDATAM